MRVNEAQKEAILLSSIEIMGLLVPENTERDKKISQGFNGVEESLNSQDNIMMNVIKYSFVLRYLSNN